MINVEHINTLVVKSEDKNIICRFCSKDSESITVQINGQHMTFWDIDGVERVIEVLSKFTKEVRDNAETLDPGHVFCDTRIKSPSSPFAEFADPQFGQISRGFKEGF